MMNGHLEPMTLSMFMDDALSPVEREPVAAHLATCALCGAHLADLRRLNQAVRELPVPAVPEGVFAVASDPVVRRPGRGRLGALIPLPNRTRHEPVTAGATGRVIRPRRSWWVAPVAALSIAAALVLVSVTLVCRGVPSLAACGDAWFGGAGRPVAAWPPAPGPTAVVRQTAPGTAAAGGMADAPGTTANPTQAAGTAVAGLALTSVPDGPVTPVAYPGPGGTEVAAAVGTSSTGDAPGGGPVGAYPGPGASLPVATALAPALRKTQAAVAAGLATLAADGGLVSVFLPLARGGR
jgi:hypothetical protein